MRLVRTQFAYEEIANHMAIVGRNALLESYFVQYLLIAFYAEVEERLKETITKRLSQINDEKVAHFIYKTNESMIKRVRKSEINDLLQKFNCGDGDVISEALAGKNLQPYFDAITNRHLVSHRDGASMTLDAFSEALPCAEEILEAVENLLGA